MARRLYPRSKLEQIILEQLIKMAPVILYCLTEEPSILPVVKHVWNKFVLPELPEGARQVSLLETRYHQGKQDLKRALSKAAPSLSRMPGAKLLVLIDQDNSDCKQLKQELEDELSGRMILCPYKIRIVCRELEAWFLGDPEAIGAAFPRFRPESIAARPDFRNPDELQSPSQRLLELIPEYQSKGYQNLPKKDAAKKFSPHLSRQGNRSQSFKQFVEAAISLSRDA